ncbi:hypothetical protein [Isoptericola sp. NPDC055881]
MASGKRLSTAVGVTVVLGAVLVVLWFAWQRFDPAPAAPVATTQELQTTITQADQVLQDSKGRVADPQVRTDLEAAIEQARDLAGDTTADETQAGVARAEAVDDLVAAANRVQASHDQLVAQQDRARWHEARDRLADLVDDAQHVWDDNHAQVESVDKRSGERLRKRLQDSNDLVQAEAPTTTEAVDERIDALRDAQENLDAAVRDFADALESWNDLQDQAHARH